MALTSQQVFLAILRADASQAVSEFRKVDGQVDQVTTSSVSRFSKFSTVAKGALAGIGTAAVFSLGKQAVGAASDLNESINAVEVTFGDAAAGVLDLGEKAANAVGLSNAEFNTLAVSFSSFATKVAGEGGDVVGTIETLTQRAADFASVMNIDVAEAARIFQSGLAGEAEPLKRFGINLLDSEVKAYALAEGIIKVGETMTEAQKVQARYGLLMQETSKTSGDFANTSDGLANSQRRVSAQLTNVSAKIGATLIPAIEDAIPVVEGLITVLDKIGGTSISNPFQFDTQDTVDAFIDTTGEMEKYHSEFEGGIDLSKRYSDAQNLVAREIANAKVEFDQAAALVTFYSENMSGVEAAVSAALTAQERQNDALAEQRSKFDAAADSVYALHDAEYAAARAIEDANEALSTADGDLYAIRQQTERAAVAIGDLADEQVTATGVTRDSAQGQRVWTQKMLESAAALSGPLRSETLAYIARMNGIPESKITEIRAQDNASAILMDHLARLGAIPREVTTRLRVTGQTVTRGGDIIGQRSTDGTIKVGATGGIVTRPTMALIGEAGPEAVVPLNRAPGASPLPGPLPAMTSTTTTFAPNITVNAGMGADGARIGNLIIETIKQYERHNGAGWRST
jgi:hypothetical protein